MSKRATQGERTSLRREKSEGQGGAMSPVLSRNQGEEKSLKKSDQRRRSISNPRDHCGTCIQWFRKREKGRGKKVLQGGARELLFWRRNGGKIIRAHKA